MKQKSPTYMAIGPLAYKFISDYRIEGDSKCVQFFHDAEPETKTGDCLVVECEVMVADDDIRIDGNLVFQDLARSVFVNAQGLETRVMIEDGKPYAVCRETFKASLQLIVAKFCVSDGCIVINSYILEALMMERYILRIGGLILHSSFIVHEGRSILFTAPSGTGKSTQASLWEKYTGAEIVNGDRSVVWYDSATKTFMTSGLPFCGSSGINKDKTVPLACIAFIEQAPQNSIEPLAQSIAARKLTGETSINKWSAEVVGQSLDLIGNLVASVPMVLLRCNMEEGAVTTLRAYLDRQHDKVTDKQHDADE